MKSVTQQIEVPFYPAMGKREVFNLFSGCKVILQKLTLAPPIGRPVAHLSVVSYRVLATIKPFCPHYLGLIIKL